MKYSGHLFENRKMDLRKMKLYGFEENGQCHTYSAKLSAGNFTLTVSIEKGGGISTKLMDLDADEEYGLVYVENAASALARAVKAEYEDMLRDIAEKCFSFCAFKSEYAQMAIDYIRKEFGGEPEYLWERFPGNAVFREKLSSKWYAALLTVQKRKVGLDEDGEVEIIDLKNTPEEISKLVDGKNFLPGYHMNKKHWYTVRLDGSVPFAEISRLIGLSVKTVLRQKGKPAKAGKKA